MTHFIEPDANAPIGVFDSGLGGLTVVRRLREVLPNERIYYVADQAHVPYGGRDLSEVRRFACSISAALTEVGCKAIVMACNISSATAMGQVHDQIPDRPVVGVIRPGAQAAAQRTRCGRIGVLATAGTVASAAYTETLRSINPSLQITEVACPDFVPLVEAGKLDTPEALLATETYMAPLRAARVDTIILGCTHYPFLMPTLCRVSDGVRFIDPAEQTALDVAERLATAGLLSREGTTGHLLTTTGDALEFAGQVTRFLPNTATGTKIDSAQWRDGALRLPPFLP